jgi:hypothetical protein
VIEQTKAQTDDHEKLWQAFQRWGVHFDGRVK